ncbi:hypothetical protein [Pseudopedobacter beijingensis]|uniref:Tetratricopeptide repeat-containing protein n=1 Tax=Pseudopedobacter beijingensis TaxID=1207056 RepID=A0ABW4IAT8_9SPHI
MFTVRRLRFVILVFFLSPLQKVQAINLSLTTDATFYIDSIFNTQKRAVLVGEELKYLTLDNKALGIAPLDLNVFLSSISYIEDNNAVVNLSQTLTLLSFNPLITAKVQLLKYLAIQDVLNSQLKFAEQKLESALFICQLKREDKEAAMISSVLSQINYIQLEGNIALLNNLITMNAYKHIQDDEQLLTAWLWRAKLYLAVGEYKAAEDLLMKKALMKSYKFGDKEAEMKVYYLLGQRYFITVNDTESLWFYLQAATLSEKLRQYDYTIQSLLMVSEIKMKRKDYSLALQDLRKVEDLIVANPKQIKYDVDLCEKLGKIYHLLGQEDKAKIYQLRYSQLKKQIINKEE